MEARTTSGAHAPHNLNHLRRGESYHARTAHGTATGEYLGMESMFGDRAILLRHPAGTASIQVSDIESILLVAA